MFHWFYCKHETSADMDNKILYSRLRRSRRHNPTDKRKLQLAKRLPFHASTYTYTHMHAKTETYTHTVAYTPPCTRNAYTRIRNMKICFCIWTYFFTEFAFKARFTQARSIGMITRRCTWFLTMTCWLTINAIPSIITFLLTIFANETWLAKTPTIIPGTKRQLNLFGKSSLPMEEHAMTRNEFSSRNR